CTTGGTSFVRASPVAFGCNFFSRHAEHSPPDASFPQAHFLCSVPPATRVAPCRIIGQALRTLPARCRPPTPPAPSRPPPASPAAAARKQAASAMFLMLAPVRERRLSQS